ncbi:hypothetical protein SAMN04487990_10888 [Bizionia paragorgiae]|jgi:hypothetical protein|uniref:Uncharacterized protein n=1 Tax=Bizionia paragorgiae TaxID=283786 RepID=A0A1H3ZC66_BIZPA|nr:hypothetical protein SAMN04487990_10888 [Bizionia paragorgiae]
MELCKLRVVIFNILSILFPDIKLTKVMFLRWEIKDLCTLY